MPSATSLKRRRLLVVDDHPALRKSLKQRLEQEGATVETADSVATARKALAEYEWDLVVPDHRLPDGTGLGLLEEQKRAGSKSAFVMMTAHSSTQDAVRAIKMRPRRETTPWQRFRHRRLPRGAIVLERSPVGCCCDSAVRRSRGSSLAARPAAPDPTPRPAKRRFPGRSRGS